MTRKIVKMQKDEKQYPKRPEQNFDAKTIAKAFIRLADDEILEFHHFGHKELTKSFLAYVRVVVSRIRKAAIQRGLKIRSFRVNTILLEYNNETNLCKINLAKKGIDKSLEKELDEIFDDDSAALL